MTTEGIGFAIDWKNVVASITNPKIGVIQKFVLNPTIPNCSISSVAPNANRIDFGKSKTISQMIQVIPTENADA